MMMKTETSCKLTVVTKRKRENQKQIRSMKRHSPDSHKDVVGPKGRKNILDLPPSNEHAGDKVQQQSYSFAVHPILGCNGDDSRSSHSSEVSQDRDQEWSLEKLKNAPKDIARVQSLISHLMLVGLSAAESKGNMNADPDDSSDELTHDERTLDLLHDQCHTMLKGLQSHLELLFHYFQYDRPT